MLVNTLKKKKNPKNIFWRKCRYGGIKETVGSCGPSQFLAFYFFKPHLCCGVLPANHMQPYFQHYYSLNEHKTLWPQLVAGTGVIFLCFWRMLPAFVQLQFLLSQIFIRTHSKQPALFEIKALIFKHWWELMHWNGVMKGTCNFAVSEYVQIWAGLLNGPIHDHLPSLFITLSISPIRCKCYQKIFLLLKHCWKTNYLAWRLIDTGFF